MFRNKLTNREVKRYTKDCIKSFVENYFDKRWRVVL